MDITLPDGSIITIPDPSGVSNIATGATVSTPADYSLGTISSVPMQTAQDYANYFASPAGGGMQSQATFDAQGNAINVPPSSYGANDPFNTASLNYGPASISEAQFTPVSQPGGQQAGVPQQSASGLPPGFMRVGDYATNGRVSIPLPAQAGGNIMGALGSLMKGDFKGAMSDPKGLMGVLGLIGAAGSMFTKPKAPPTAAQLMTQLPPSPYNNFTPANQALMDSFSKNFSPKVQNIRAATFRNYASGGKVRDDSVGWTQDGIYGPKPPVRPISNFASGGALSALVQGDGSGQQDNVKAHLSPGEYVMDADTVAALGDGSTDAGAAVLDKARERIRAHKRSAPASKIPPKAKPFAAYLKGGKA